VRDEVGEALARWRAGATRTAGVLVVAVDGPGASGKSTLALWIAAAAGAALLHTDDFFAAADASAPPARLADYYEWPRLRAEALTPLLAGRTAAFRRFDWSRGSLGVGLHQVRPQPVVVVEGVQSAGPALADLVDRAVLVETPAVERERRLRARVAPEEWDERWLAAERDYFDSRPLPSYDLVVGGTSQSRPVRAGAR
jgi:uridine kinase